MRCMKFHFSLLWLYGDFNLSENSVLSTHTFMQDCYYEISIHTRQISWGGVCISPRKGLTESPLPPAVPWGPGKPLSPFSPGSPGGPIRPIRPGWPCSEQRRGGGRKSRSQTRTLESSQGDKIFAVFMKLTNVNRVDHSFILPSFITGRRGKQPFKVKQEKNNDGFMHNAWLAHPSRVLFLTIKNDCVYCGCHI